MKIKNLAFFGIMAAILGVNGAARADSTTIIASQAYVDAKDALKQNILNSGANGNVSVTSGNGTTTSAITGVTANGDGTVTFTTQDIAIPGASNFVEDSITDGHTDKAPSGNAVYDEIHVASDGNYIRSANTVAQNLSALDTRAKTNADNISTNTTNISTNTTNISANTSAIEALNKAIEKGLTTEQQTLYDAWVEAGRKPTDLAQLLTDMGVDATDNVVSDYQKGHQNLIPRNRNIQKGIAYLKGNGIEHYTPGVNNSSNDATAGISNSTVARQAELAWKENYLANKGDDYVPTVAAVERRVQEVEATANGAVQSITEGTTNGTINVDNTDIAVHGLGSAAFTASTDYATAAQGTLADDAVRSVAEGATNGTISVNTGGTTAEVAVHGLGSAAYVSKGANTADNTANSLVNVDANGFVTGTAAAGALAKKSVITYATDTDSKLSNVNATGDAETAMTNCTLKSPCTLTMIWNNGAPVYEWTNMDTEDTSATL